LGSVVTSNFDELVIDTQPIVRDDGSYSTNTNVEAYRHIQAAAVPFWLVVRCDGYGKLALQSRDAALAMAQNLTASLWADVNAYMLQNFMGFAYLQADLNVVFPDGTCIDRTFQNALVQVAHSNFRAAMMVTSRPNDHVTMVAPTIITAPPQLINTNSGQALSYSLLGSSPVFQDRIMFLYPNPAVNYPNISAIVSQVQSMYTARARDTGFPLNLSFGCVVPVDASGWTPDGLVGLLSSPAVEILKAVFSFLGALGVQYLGIQSGPIGSMVPVPPLFMPDDSAINVSGGSNVWSDDTEVFVSYFDPNGSRVQRAFDQYFVERLID
jgi:hypothetical protein